MYMQPQEAFRGPKQTWPENFFMTHCNQYPQRTKQRNISKSYKGKMATHLKRNMSEQHQNSQENPSQPGTHGMIYFKLWKWIAANQDCLSPKYLSKSAEIKTFLEKDKLEEFMGINPGWRELKGTLHTEKKERLSRFMRTQGRVTSWGELRKIHHRTPAYLWIPIEKKRINNNLINQKNNKITGVNKCVSL